MYGYTQEEDRRQDPDRQDVPNAEGPVVTTCPFVDPEDAPENVKDNVADHLRWLLDAAGLHPDDAIGTLLSVSEYSMDAIVNELVQDEGFNLFPMGKFDDFTKAVITGCGVETYYRVHAPVAAPSTEAVIAPPALVPKVEVTKPSIAGEVEAPKACTMRVVAEVEGSAQPVLDALWKKWHPDFKETFTVTLGDAIGGTLRIQATYTVKGANSNDGGKKVRNAAESVGVKILSMRNWSITDPSAAWGSDAGGSP